ncbi:MAG: DMT family transporter [Anaerolineae bacterium]|nr:DMT family transporter [Anaerolineae bacterium]
MPKTKIIPYLEALFAVLVWGGTFIATKIALGEVSPATIVWIRFGMGTVILGIVVTARRQFAIPDKSEWLYFAMLGFLGVTFHQILQATGLQTAKATTTAWIVATTPVFIAILGWIALKEKLNGIQILGIALAGFGVLLIVSKGNISALFTGE